MTYCVGMLVDDGLAMIADTRTNAGVDNISSVTDRLGSFSPLKKDIDWLDFVEWDSVTSGQSYKGSMIVNYDSRIIIWAIF